MPAVPVDNLAVELQGLSADTPPTTLQQLVASNPVLILAVRRPGCVLCRAQAQRLWQRKGEVEALGFKVVCVVHQSLPTEVEAFAKSFWTGPLYLDPTKSLYKLLHNGRVRKGGIMSFFNANVWARIRSATREVSDHNLTGDGTTLGGMLLVAKGGTFYTLFPEKDFGDYPPLEEVLAAAAKLKA